MSLAKDSSQYISISVRNHIGYVVLNRPEQHNAMSRQMWEALPKQLVSLKESGAKLIIISGSGTSFAAGADLAELAQIDGPDSAKKNWQAIANCLNFLASFDLPTIACINGACLGGGLLLACACDLRYAAESATFALPVAKLGIVLDDQNVLRLTRLIGPQFAKELMFSGQIIDSQKALAIGLVASLHKPEQLSIYVDEQARKIAANAHTSILAAKRSIDRVCQILSSHENEEAVIESYLSSEFRARIKGVRPE